MITLRSSPSSLAHRGIGFCLLPFAPPVRLICILPKSLNEMPLSFVTAFFRMSNW